ncbi:hypothetical protein FB384_004515 [Prauserella sediminis]|uniref:Glycosyl hydrolase family 39 n=1 Tax=Prauserella sediminis TaxID=577680 RepID=A0A839XS39_9PSEU|nr:hypothetical protein [Prauserella sediminis]MBB3665557.1 hypothetical protein [Prauserella sediminis]
MTAAAEAAAGADTPEAATVNVEFGDKQGDLPRTEKYNNFGNATAWPDERGDDVDYLNKQGLHGEIYRVWLSSPNAPAEFDLFNSCDVESRSCDFSTLDDYLTHASTVSDSVMANLNPMAFMRGDRPLRDLEPLLEVMIHSLKEQYPAVDYVEVFNEPDWNFHGEALNQGEEPILQPDELYRYYRPFYEAVDEVNRGLRRKERIQVGGPALMSRDAKWLEPFLDAYAADRDRAKRLDFLSYHAYLSWDDNYQVANPYKDDLRVVASDRKNIERMLADRGLSDDIPSFVTETGIYPGPSFDDPEPKNDYLRQAAGMATYSHLFANQSDTYMFNWCVRHRVEERKDQLVTRTADGPEKDIFTPYGNMMLMQSRLKDTRVSAETGPPLEGDNGVYATASKDKAGASVMVWNWQHVNDTTYRTEVDMSDLPRSLKSQPVRQRMFRIDQTTSNYFADPAKADLQQVDEKIIEPGASHSVSVDLSPNAMYLILLEPA